jgi:hypothetical protein
MFLLVEFACIYEENRAFGVVIMAELYWERGGGLCFNSHVS